jgi:hypothetical protein
VSVGKQQSPNPLVPLQVRPGKHTSAPIDQPTQSGRPVPVPLPCHSHADRASADTSSAASWQLLEEFTKKEFKGLAAPLMSTPQQRQAIREALQVRRGAGPARLGPLPCTQAPAGMQRRAQDLPATVRPIPAAPLKQPPRQANSRPRSSLVLPVAHLLLALEL